MGCWRLGTLLRVSRNGDRLAARSAVALARGALKTAVR
jgi:hypothetical protein